MAGKGGGGEVLPGLYQHQHSYLDFKEAPFVILRRESLRWVTEINYLQLWSILHMAWKVGEGKLCYEMPRLLPLYISLFQTRGHGYAFREAAEISWAAKLFIL